MSGPGDAYTDEDGQPVPFGEEVFANLFEDPFADTTASEFEVTWSDGTGERE